MELLDLKIFCDLVELKSFTDAASKNFLTQSAVSQRMNKLNDYYGNKIFLNRKQLILSGHGKYLYEKFKDILRIYSYTEEMLERKDDREIVSIGMCENARAKYFNHKLMDRLSKHAFVPEIYFGPSQSIYEKVLFGTLDYGIVGSPPQKQTEIVFDELYAEKIVLATSSANPVEDVSIESVPLILDHRDSGLYLFLKTRLMTLGIDIEQLNIKGYVGTSVDKFKILKGTNLYCFVPEWYLKQGSKLIVAQLDFDLIRNFYEIYQKKKAGKIAFLSEFISKSNKQKR